MATLSDLVNGALKEILVLEAGSTASSPDFADGLTVVQELIASLPEYGGGRQMVDTETNSSATALEDQRVIATVSGLTITAPPAPRDGARLAVVPLTGTATVAPGNRKIEGATSTVTVSAATTWIYRADLADWVKVVGLAKEDASPWPSWADRAIKLLAARNLANMFDVQLTAGLGREIQRAEAMLAAKFFRPAIQDFAQSVPQTVRGAGRFRR